MGTMYQQPVIVALCIYYLYLLVLIILKRISVSKDRALFILPAWVTLATALPYLIITRFIYVPFGYGFFLSELFSKGAYLEQTKLTLSGLSIIHILFLAGGIITIIRKRDALFLFSFIWFSSYFLFQIIYPYSCAIRLLVPYFPVLAIWMGRGLGRVVEKKRVISGALVFLVLACSISTSTIWVLPPLSPAFMLYSNIHSRYLPYPEAIMYLKKNFSPEERCISPGHSSPEKFYSLKVGLPPSQIDHTIWEKVELQTGDNLYKYAKSQQIKFCLFPSGDWAEGFLNLDLRDRLIRGEDRRFILDKVFLSGQNKLYLLEVK